VFLYGCSKYEECSVSNIWGYIMLVFATST
jgi:hypothetical protein